MTRDNNPTENGQRDEQEPDAAQEQGISKPATTEASPSPFRAGHYNPGYWPAY